MDLERSAMAGVLSLLLCCGTEKRREKERSLMLGLTESLYTAELESLLTLKVEHFEVDCWKAPATDVFHLEHSH